MGNVVKFLTKIHSGPITLSAGRRVRSINVMRTLHNQSARRVILHLQGLSRSPSEKLDAEQLHELICQLGLVQVDSIRWVERAQHMILFSRSQHYRPIHLKHLIEERRLLFENYTHDASIIPSKFFQYWRHRFARDKDRLRNGLIRWQGDGFVAHCDTLQRKIRRSGAVRSRDLKRTGTKDTKEMWQWHDGKAALEFLWRTGKLGIASRDGFQKVYDLSERVIHPSDFSQRCSRAEFIDWSCREAITRLGFATPSEIAEYWKHVSIAEVQRWLRRQSEETIVPLTVENADGSADEGLYARADIESIAAQSPKPPSRVRVLSPFDPVIRNRGRLERLFGFRYRIEIYVPEAKRQYGYYVFPMLEGDRLIGRIDMRADRAESTLEIKRLWMEDGIALTSARRKRIDQELSRIAKLAEVDQVRWLRASTPANQRSRSR